MVAITFGLCEQSDVTTGERLQYVIGKKLPGRTQLEVAKYLEVAPGTLSEWLTEKYEPSLESLRNLAGRLRCSVASLIGNESATGSRAS